MRINENNVNQSEKQEKADQEKSVLKELEDAFSEAKDIKKGKKQGLTLGQILLAE